MIALHDPISGKRTAKSDHENTPEWGEYRKAFLVDRERYEPEARVAESIIGEP
jgi:hypothetical protein